MQRLTVFTQYDSIVVWREGSGSFKGLYTCQVCIDGIWRAAKLCARHVASQKHERANKFDEENRTLPRRDEENSRRKTLSERSLSKSSVGLRSDDDSQRGPSSLHAQSSWQSTPFCDENESSISRSASPNNGFDMDDNLLEAFMHEGSQVNDSTDSEESSSTYASEIEWLADGVQVDLDTYSDEEPELLGDKECDEPCEFIFLSICQTVHSPS